MGEKEVIMYLSIVQWSTWTWRFFLGSGHYLFLFMARNHLFVFFTVKCTISGWFYISYNEEEKSVNAVWPPSDMAFQNLLIWRQYRSPCLYSSLAASLMPVASLLTMLPHQSCHLWIPASNDSRLLLSFIDEDHKRKSYPGCAGKCEWWFIPAMSNLSLGLLQTTHGKRHLPIVFGSLSAIITVFLEHDLFQCWPRSYFPLTCTSGEHRWAAQGKARRVVLFTQEMSVPCPHDLQPPQKSTSHVHHMRGHWREGLISHLKSPQSR